MSLAENLGDLEMHARHFEQRCGFTYAVLDPRTNEVIGCVYIYPAAKPTGAGHAACVRSWTRVDRAELDEPLRLAVRAWLGQEWPFEQVVYSTHD
jgi:hypothetical protein